MTRKLRATLATAIVAAATILATPTLSSATTCIPVAGQEYIAPTYAVEAEYTRTIPGTDPVLGEPPVITPGTPAWTETIEHPAEHATDYLYTKQVQGIWQQRTGWGGWQDTGETFGWETYSGNLTRWESATFTETGPHSAVQATEGKKRKVSTQYRYVQTGETRQGAETKPAWTQTIEHDAIDPVLGEPPVITPGTDPSTETKWVEQPGTPEGDGWTATGQTRTGEGVTRVTDPGQEAIEPVTCPTPQPEPSEDPDTEPVNPGDTTAPTLEPTAPPVAPAAPVAAPIATSAAPLAAAPTSSPATDELATTGSSTTALVLTAAGLMLVGGTALAAARARRRS